MKATKGKSTLTALKNIYHKFMSRNATRRPTAIADQPLTVHRLAKLDQNHYRDLNFGQRCRVDECLFIRTCHAFPHSLSQYWGMAAIYLKAQFLRQVSIFSWLRHVCVKLMQTASDWSGSGCESGFGFGCGSGWPP